MSARADLHIHSKHSNRPSEWILRRLGSPESFVEPRAVYDACREAGMDYVTISDHNCIDGALEIADLPGTFISNEVTTYFPENGAKLHCLVTAITPEQFERVQELREDVYAFRDYVIQNDIIYSLAHPFFLVNDRLTVDQVEKLMLLFNRFEGINGARDPRAANMVRAVFGNITPEMIERLADKHGIDPIGPEPWRKCFTGGSDDHSGVYAGAAHTITPEAPTLEVFLEHLRAGRHEPGGSSGTSLKLAHSFYHIAASYYASRFLGAHRSDKPSLIGELFKKLLETQPQAAAAPSLTGRVRHYVGGVVRSRRIKKMNGIERMLVEEFAKLFPSEDAGDPAEAVAPEQRHRQTFEISCRISQQLGYTFFKNLTENARQGRLVETVQTLAAVGPVALSVAPYLAAFMTQHKDEHWLRRTAEHFQSARGHRMKSQKKAWLTDTFFIDEHGVTKTLRAIGATAASMEKPLTVVTCEESPSAERFAVKNFEPVGLFRLPEYNSLKLPFPPFLEVIEYLEREKFDHVIISTPGPMGLTAIAAAKLLGLRTTGIYHTDFPSVARMLTEDKNLEALTWRYMYWFYEQCDQIRVPSEYYRRELAENGFTERKLAVMTRGVDHAVFRPDRRDPAFFSHFGVGEGLKFLYVGQISPEKGLENLIQDFLALSEEGHKAQLVLVGDGPQLAELKKRYKRPDVHFTGFLPVEDLATAYASADVFVYPSQSDTFGNSVLEAHASGLPAIVLDRGGPPEIVRTHSSGLVAPLDTPRALLEPMRRVASDPSILGAMREAALNHAAECRWEHVVEDLWRDPAPSHATITSGSPEPALAGV